MKQPVDLNQIYASTHYGCMDLPQELVDHVMGILHNDIPALKACSLACSLRPDASTKHCILPRKTLSVLTPEEERRYRKGSHDVELRFVSFMDERGLQYAQRVRICTLDPFTPEILLPHLHDFQSLNQVHTLIIDHCCPTEWMSYHASCFTRSYPTLTDTIAPGLSPPLRGHLRMVGYNPLVQLWADLFREPPKGFNFPSIEIENFLGNQAQRALNACAQTLENLAIAAYISGILWLPFLSSAIAGRFLTFQQ